MSDMISAMVTHLPNTAPWSRKSLKLKLTHHTYYNMTYLDPEINPFTKVFTSLTPLDIHPTRIDNPDSNVTIVADALILFRN